MKCFTAPARSLAGSRRGRALALLLGVAALALAPGRGRAEGEAGAPGAQPASGRLVAVVCDSHHHVLRHWLEAARAGVLPGDGFDVVHFDAHPDLGPPPVPIRREWRAQPGVLERAVDIESYQLAAAWLGLVRRVVWLRPSWAFQLSDGVRRFQVGVGPAGRLQVDDRSDYYVLEDHYQPSASLRDPVALELVVRALPDALSGGPLHAGPMVLDVDLDGFATRNPAAERLRAGGFSDAELDRIRSAFARERLSLPEDPLRRQAALRELLGALEAVAGGHPTDQLAGAARLWWMGVPAADLWFLSGLLLDEARALPVELLLEHGRTLVGIPERRAAAAEIAATARQLGELVAGGALRPDLVTIARSANDGYTPHEALPLIEASFLDALRAARPDLEIRYDRGLRPLPRP